MKKLVIVFFLLSTLIEFGCLKKHDCYCTSNSSNGSGTHFIVKGTESRARKKCQSYSHENGPGASPTICNITD